MDPEPRTDAGLKLSTNRLNDFLLALREDHEYDLGLPQIYAVKELIFTLAVAGLDINDPDLLRRHLRPIVCTSHPEQEQFERLFEEWRMRLFVTVELEESGLDAGRSDEDEVLEFAHNMQRAKRAQLRSRLVTGAAVVITVFLVYLSIGWISARDAPGELHVNVDPGPAWVVLTGVDDVPSPADSLLGLTPVVHRFSRGAYNISLRSPGFETIDTSIVVRARSTTVIDVELNRIRDGSRVFVPGAVPGATVIIDGIEAGFVTDQGVLSRRLSRGLHDIRLVADGYEAWRQSVSIDSDSMMLPNVAMNPIANSSEPSIGPLAGNTADPDAQDTGRSSDQPGRTPVDFFPGMSLRGSELAIRDTDGLIRVHDAETGDLQTVYSPYEIARYYGLRPPSEWTPEIHASRSTTIELFRSWNVRSVDFISPDVVVAGTWAGQIERVDIRTGDRTTLYAGTAERVDADRVRRPMISGVKYVPADNSVAFTMEHGVVHRLLLDTGEELFGSPPGRMVQGLAVSGDTVVVGGKSGVYLFHPNGQFEAKVSTDEVVDLARLDDTFLVATIDGSLCLTGSAMDECRARLSGRLLESVTETLTATDLEFAAGRHDGTIRFYDETLAETRRFEGHTDRIMDLAVDPTGRYLASAGWDQTIRLWDLETGDHLVTLFGHQAHVWTVDWSPDGGTLVSGGRDGTIRIWDLAWLPYVQAPGWLASLGGGVGQSVSGLFTARRDDEGALAVIDRRTGERVMSVTGTREGISVLSQSPSGSRIVSGGLDGSVDLLDGPLVFSHDDGIASAAYSPGAREVTAITWVGERFIWDTDSRQLKIRDFAPPESDGSDGGWSHVMYSPDGLLRFTYILRSNSLEIAQTRTQGKPVILRSSDRIRVNTFSSAQRARSDSDTDYMYIQIGDRLTVIEPSSYSASRVRSDSGSGREGIRTPGYGQLHLAARLDRILVEAEDSVSVWSVDRPRLIVKRSGIPPIDEVVIAGDSLRFLTSENGQLRLWSVDTLTEIASIPYDNDLLGAEFNRSGDWLAVSNRASATAPGAIRIWDTVSGRQVGEALTQPDGVLGVELNEADDSILSWGDFSVQIWDLSTSSRRFDRYVPGIQGGLPVGVDAAILYPARNRIVVGDRSGDIRMIDMDTGIEDSIRFDLLGRIGGLFVDNRSGDLVAWSAADVAGLSEIIRWDTGTGDEIWRRTADGSTLHNPKLDARADLLSFESENGSTHLSWTTGWEMNAGIPADNRRTNADKNGRVQWDDYGFVYVFPASSVEIARRDTTVMSAIVTDGGRVASSFADGQTLVLDVDHPDRPLMLQSAGTSSSLTMDPHTGVLASFTEDGGIQHRLPRSSRLSTIGIWMLAGGWSVLIGLLILWQGGRVLVSRRSTNRATRFLVRERRRDQLESRRVRMQNVVDHIVPSTAIHRLSSALRRRYEVLSGRLDVPGTLKSTVRRGGLFNPVFGSRQEVPEYVVLIERISFRDHQSRYVDEIVSELVDADIVISRFYYDGDPRVCFPADGRGRPVRLGDLASATGGRRMIVFGSAASFFNSISGEPVEWLSVFDAWPVCYFVAMESESEFGHRERLLRERFSDVVPCTTAGLMAIAGTEMSTTTAGERGPDPYPLSLHRRPRIWVDPSPPKAAILEKMFSELRGYLGPDGMAWLRATAVYPDVDWRLTVYLGHVLRSTDSRRLLTPDLVLRLVRLPWFRIGTIPDWMRERLLDDMPEEQELKVRAILNTLIFRPADPDADPLSESVLPGELEIAVENARTVNSLGRRLLDSRSNRMDDRHPLRDRVFVKFLRDGRRTPLAVRIPRTLADALGGDAESRTPLKRAGRYAAVGVAGILLVTMLTAGSRALWTWIPPTVTYTEASEVVAWPESTEGRIDMARSSWEEFGIPVIEDLPAGYYEIIDTYFGSVETKDHDRGLDSLMTNFSSNRRVVIEMIRALETDDHPVPETIAHLYLNETDRSAWTLGMIRSTILFCETRMDLDPGNLGWCDSLLDRLLNRSVESDFSSAPDGTESS